MSSSPIKTREGDSCVLKLLLLRRFTTALLSVHNVLIDSVAVQRCYAGGLQTVSSYLGLGKFHGVLVRITGF